MTRPAILFLALIALPDLALAAPCDAMISKADAFMREANQSVAAAAGRSQAYAARQAAHYCGMYGRLLGAYEGLRIVAAECLKSDRGGNYLAALDKTAAEMTTAFERSCR